MGSAVRCGERQYPSHPTLRKDKPEVDLPNSEIFYQFLLAPEPKQKHSSSSPKGLITKSQLEEALDLSNEIKRMTHTLISKLK